MNDIHWREALAYGLKASAGYSFAVPHRRVRGRAGYHQGHKQGSSLEYKDFRDYQPGDDLRWIDWSAYARSDRLTIKRFHEEVAPRVDIVLDNSASMNLDESRKAATALAFSSFVAGCAIHSGFQSSLWTVGEQCRRLPRHGNLPTLWQADWFTETRSPDSAFQQQPTFTNGGLRFFLSDLMWQGDPTPIIRSLTRDAVAVVLVQVLAHRDREPHHGGKWRLVDAETGQTQELSLDRSHVARYQEALSHHQNLWRQSAARFGALFVAIDADHMWRDWHIPQVLFQELLQVRAG